MLAVLLVAGGTSVANEIAPKSQPDVTLYQGSYPGWPWIARTPAGKLVATFREGNEHGYSPNGRVLVVESTDEGKTWTAPKVVADQKDVDDRNAAILALSDDDWLVSYNTYTADLVSRPVIVRTLDGGRTWSAPQMVADIDARTRSAAIKLSSGELLLPIYRAQGNGSLCARSEDNGKTWQIVPLADSDGYVGDEWSLAEVSPGRVVGIHRNNHSTRDGFLWRTESADAGKTWSSAERTNVQCQRHPAPAQLFVVDGKPILAYADRRMVSLSLVTTDDPKLLNWDLDRRLTAVQYLPDGSPISDAGYPSVVSLGKNKLMLIDYEITEEEHLVTGYFVELPQDWLGQ
ncbi:MAG: exo-alpha-sialidase [Pirellulales bacterium]|nr:exo-alpha-sialidase [Pirellulales bacterium]